MIKTVFEFEKRVEKHFRIFGNRLKVVRGLLAKHLSQPNSSLKVTRADLETKKILMHYPIKQTLQLPDLT